VNLYVETNFVLELALLQEQAGSCDEILRLCESGRAKLVIPASAVAEASATLNLRGIRRQDMKQNLDRELHQLARTGTYSQRLQGFREITALLVESAITEAARLSEISSRLLWVAEIVSLDALILSAAEDFRTNYDLRPPDALVLASVLGHLGDEPGAPSCFLSRDSDFEDPKIIEDLSRRRCKLIGRFDHGLAALLGESSTT
jgi:predicted nucleic acid-binding protein